MNDKVAFENQICRLAIDWERLHAEHELPATIDPEVSMADVRLASAVKAYRDYLVVDALPVPEERDPDA